MKYLALLLRLLQELLISCYCASKYIKKTNVSHPDNDPFPIMEKGPPPTFRREAIPKPIVKDIYREQKSSTNMALHFCCI